MPKKKCGKIGLRDSVWIVLSAPTIAVLYIMIYWVSIPSHKALSFCFPISGTLTYVILFYLSLSHPIFICFFGLFIVGGVFTVLAARRVGDC